MNIHSKLKALGAGEETLGFAETLRVNAFNKNGYEVNTPFGLKGFNGFLEAYTLQKDITKAVPRFQRHNDKWTLEMKQSFILNVLKGVNSQILLATYDRGDSHFIIDGYQRATAIYQFNNGEFDLANGMSAKYVYENNLHKVASFKVSLKVYEFDTIEESVRFYIDMNENITHSKMDIQKAKDYLRAIKEEGLVWG